MIKIIVVEDSQEYQDKIKDVLVSLNNADIKAEYFKKFDSKLKEIINDNSEKKIYIMDIELGSKVSGINIAKYIRENDWESEILFITSHDKMFETAYRSVYKVFDFIEKFHNTEKRLAKDLKEILKRNFDNKVFRFESRNLSMQIYYRSILYMFRDKETRKLNIVTDNNTYEISLPLADVKGMLDKRFVMVHRACIVNVRRVENFYWSKGYFVTDKGHKVDMLLKKYRKDVEDAINK